MSIQRESLQVGNPFDVVLRSRGWDVRNIHGNQYQKGLPDRFISHPMYTSRWIEYKVFNKHYKVKITDAQAVVFPILLHNNVPIYAICAQDLRGVQFKRLRERLYKKLFDPPNGSYLLNPMMHQLLR